MIWLVPSTTLTLKLKAEITKCKKKRKFLGCTIRSKTKYKTQERNLSDRERDLLIAYAQHKAFHSFRSRYAGEIAGDTCSATGGCP